MIELLFDKSFYRKKILITGDTGFKGSWLAVWLKELQADVYGYALPPVSDDDNFVKCNLSQKIHHLDGDIRDFDKLVNYFTKVQPEIVFHLAAQPLVLESYKDPRYTFETNIIGTVNVFEAVRKTKSVKVAINVTSDKCYNNNEWVWGYRETDPMGGKDPYSASKGCSELVTSSYINSFFTGNTHCAVASARAGNVIGGGDWAEHRILPDFFRAIKKGESLVIRNPNATRPWQHVLEPLSGYLLLASKLYLEGTQFSGGWNFGPQDDLHIEVAQLIDSVVKYYGKGKVSIDNSKDKLHEANLLKLDISKAVKYLHWKPVLTFDQLIKLTVGGYSAELNGGDIYEHRKKQIEEFVELAVKRNLIWTDNISASSTVTKTNLH